MKLGIAWLVDETSRLSSNSSSSSSSLREHHMLLVHFISFPIPLVPLLYVSIHTVHLLPTINCFWLRFLA